MKHLKLLLLLCLGPAFLAPLHGVETTFWQVGAFDEFLQGTLTGVSLSKEGDMKLAPETRAVFSPEEALALSLAGDRDHNLYVGTGHQGKVFRVDANLKASLFFTAREPDVFALAVGPDGALYVGSSPEGKIYRLTPDGKSTVFYEPKAKYIWALAFDSQGRLYAGTGDRGQILRIDTNGKGEVFFDSNQTHIMCLTLDRDGNLLAGSVPNGLIYRITPQGKAFVLYQAGLPEIHELAMDAQGRIYAAALGGAGGRGTPELFMPPTAGGVGPTAVTTVTVTSSEDAQTRPSQAQNPPPEAATPPSFNRPAPAMPAIPMPGAHQGRGSLIVIRPDSTVETVWSSNNESIFGMVLRQNHILFSTDSNGRIFELDPSRDGQKLTLITETHESLATRLLLQGSDLYIATSNVAKIFRLGASPAREGTYESPVKDTKFISHWGTLAWRADVPAGASLEFFTRCGNSDRPDRTWSDWVGPYRNANGTPVSSPPARYIQWKAVFHAEGNATPTLNDVTVAYLNQNLAPQIRLLNVSTGEERTSPVGPSLPSGMAPGGTVTVSSAPPGAFGGPPVGRTAAKAPVILSWVADDPNGDQLVYSLYVKAADEHEWHLLKDKLRQTSYTVEPTTLADGKYVARLVASDAESNPPDTARSTELASAPFWIDNTPPQVRVVRQAVTPAGVEVEFRAEDSTSPLRSAETSIDGKDWQDVYSDKGVVDSRIETFTVKIPQLDPGEHVITLRAYDTAGNVGAGKAVVRVPGRPAADRPVGSRGPENPTGR